MIKEKFIFKGGVIVDSTLSFLYGKNLQEKEVAIQRGRFYLDTETGELYYDNPDPAAANDIHNKIIDSATLIYTVSEIIEFPSTGSEDDPISGGDGSNDTTSTTTAKLGTAIIGYMKLGQP